MIKIENVEVSGWKHAIRGMRNPMNSWDESDTIFIDKNYCEDDADFELAKICGGFAPVNGLNDRKLMLKLAAGGSVHAKYRRMITVYMDITAPLYWWKEFDTYKVGTVANSCSTMHKIHAKEFTLEDFSHEHLYNLNNSDPTDALFLDGRDVRVDGEDLLCLTINVLNYYRKRFLATKDKGYWWQMIQLLPSSYNQKRTIMLNYEVLAGIYPMRKDHKLDEWRKFCQWIEQLPYSKIITVM